MTELFLPMLGQRKNRGYKEVVYKINLNLGVALPMILSSVEELEGLIENEIQHLLSEQAKNAA